MKRYMIKLRFPQREGRPKEYYFYHQEKLYSSKAKAEQAMRSGWLSRDIDRGLYAFSGVVAVEVAEVSE
jgi:hypothetical protein